MNDELAKLRRLQEQNTVIAAREALDVNKPKQALSLLEGLSEFWPDSLVVCLSVIGYHTTEVELVRRAHSIFHQHLEWCTNHKTLIQVGLWSRNPVRSEKIPELYRNAVDVRRKTLDPTWDDVWINHGANTNPISKKDPSEITDPKECLIGASQVRNWRPWIERYFALGGSNENPAYIKLVVSKAVARENQKPSPRDKGLLRKFTELAAVTDVRKFLRNLTPTRDIKDKKCPNREMARLALCLYSECKRFERTVEDWIHIAKSALFLDHFEVARLTQRILIEVNDSNLADEVLGQLTLKYGPIRVTESLKNGIGNGMRSNSIWSSLHHRVPVDGNAKRITQSSSSQE